MENKDEKKVVKQEIEEKDLDQATGGSGNPSHQCKDHSQFV